MIDEAASAPCLQSQLEKKQSQQLLTQPQAALYDH